MAYIPPLNGGRINASITGNTSGTPGIVSTGPVFLAGANNITLNQSGNTISISGASAGAAAAAISAGGSLYSSGTVNFSAGGALTITSGGGQTLNFSVPNTTGITGAGIINLSTAGSSLTISAPAFSAGASTFAGSTNALGSTGTVTNQFVFAAGTNITLSQSTGAGGATMSIIGNSGGGGNLTFYDTAARSISGGSVSIIGAGAVKASITGQSLSISVPAFSAGVSNLGNSSGATGTVSNQVVLVGGSNITLSQTTGAGGATVSVNALGSSSLVAAGIISLSTNGSTVTVSAPAFSAGVSNLGNSSGATGTVSKQVVFVGGNNIALSQTTGAGGATVTINGSSGAVFSAGVTNLGNSSGATGTVSNQIVFVGGNNITLSQTTGAGGATVSVNGPTTSAGGLQGLIDPNGNSITSGNISIVTGGAIGASIAGQSLSLSAPVLSNLTGAGGVSLSSAGSTISISAPYHGTMSNWEPVAFGQRAFTTRALSTANGGLYFYKIQPEAYVTATQLQAMLTLSVGTATNVSHAAQINMQAGIYTINAAQLNLITQSSGSMSFKYTNTSSNSVSLLTGVRGLTIPMSVNMTPGDYWLGLWMQTTFTNANSLTVGYVVPFNTALTYNGLLGVASNASKGIQEGVGLYTSTTNGLLSAVPMTSIDMHQISNNAMPHIIFQNRTF